MTRSLVRRALVALVVVVLAVVFLPPLAARIFGWGPDPRALPAHARSVSIGNGIDLNVIDVGSGSPVVLVHGLPSNATDWDGVPQKLAALGHRVIAYDRVGYGYSTRAAPTADNYTYDSNARELAALLDTLGIQGATLVGWSYGGAVVQTLAQKAPERVPRLVLIAAVGPAQPSGSGDALDRVLHSRFGTAVLTWVSSFPGLSRQMTHDSLAQAFGGEAAIPPGWVDYTMAMLGLPGTLRSFVLEEQRSRVADLHPESINAPTLVIQGSEDHLVPASVGEDLHRRLPHSRLEKVRKGSHMLPVTDPDLVARQIHEFVVEGGS